MDVVSISLVPLDPYFASVVPASANPSWPLDRYKSYSFQYYLTGPCSYVLNNPYSITISLMSVANRMGARAASLVNARNDVVRPTYDSIAAGYNERVAASVQDATGTIHYTGSTDVSLSQGERTWPLLMAMNLVLPRTYSTQSCTNRAELSKFLRWMMRADNIRYSLCGDEFAAILSNEADAQLGVIESTMNIACADEKIEDGSYPSILIAGASALTIHAKGTQTIMESYNDGDPVAEYSFVEADQGKSIAELVTPGIGADVAWFTPVTFPALFPQVQANYIDTGLVITLPFGFFAVIPHFRLPDSVITKMADQLPIKMDLETLALIYTGDIIRWTDARIAAFNPGLPAAYGSLDARITLVLCGGVNGEPINLANHLMLAMNHTQAFHTSGVSYNIPLKGAAIGARLASKGAKYLVVSHEAQMENAIDRTFGALGYILSHRPEPTPTTDLAIVKTIKYANGTLEQYTVTATNQSYFKIAELTTPTANVQDFTAGFISQDPLYKDVWPIPFIMSVGVVTEMSTQNDAALTAEAVCWRATRAVKLMNYFLTDHNIIRASTISGQEAAHQLPAWNEYFASRMKECTCQGEPVLFVRPIIWSFPASVSQFAEIVSGIGLAGFLLCAAIIITLRHRSVLKAANLNLQLISLLGQALVLLGALVYAQSQSESNCQATSWLLSIGLPAMFGPICVKIVKVYHIHGQRRGVKSRKLPNLVMQLIVCIWIVVHIIVVAVAQSNGGLLAPETKILYQNDRDNYYTQCRVPDKVLPEAIAIVGLEGLAIVGCALLAFNLRGVSSAFNESRNIAWALWNTTLSSAIIVPIILITGGMEGDVGVFLMEFLVLYTTIATMIFTFGSKFYSIAYEEWEVRRANLSSGVSSTGGSKGSSRGTGTGSGTSNPGESDRHLSSIFHFPSLESVALSILEKYITSLETQIRLVRAKRRQLFGTDSQVAAGGLSNMYKPLRLRISNGDSLPGDEQSIISGEHEAKVNIILSPHPSSSPAGSPDTSPPTSPPAQRSSLGSAFDSVGNHRRAPSLGVPPVPRQPIRIGGSRRAVKIPLRGPPAALAAARK
jgi:hypothetical protein